MYKSITKQTILPPVIFVQPNRTVHEGDVGTQFLCSTPLDTTNYQWMVNGLPLDSLNLTNVEENRDRTRLIFREVPLEDNGTTVQCTALLRTGITSTSNTGILLVQGT